MPITSGAAEFDEVGSLVSFAATSGGVVLVEPDVLDRVLSDSFFAVGVAEAPTSCRRRILCSAAAEWEADELVGLLLEWRPVVDLGPGSVVDSGRRSVVSGALYARSVSGLNVGTPEPLVPLMFVPPNVHSSTSPGLGTSLIAPSWL
jgi:hypothetical protein